MGFWDDKVAPTAPEAAQPQGSLGDQYRAWQAAKSGGNGGSGSMMYSLPMLAEQRAAAPKPRIYDDGPGYQGLESYQNRPRDPLARKPSESTTAWRRRVLSIARACPDEVVQAALQAIAEAEQHGHAAEHPSARVEDLGLMGMAPADRAALVQQKPYAMADLDSRSTPMSPAAMRQAMRDREAAQRGQQPQRTDIPQSSSGEGWMVR